MKARILLLSLFLVAAFVACEEKTVPQPLLPPDKPGEELPSHADTLFYSYYGYVNKTKLPISVNFHSSNYGFGSSWRQSDSFIVYPGDKYELPFCGFGVYIGPFGLGAGSDIYVTVSNGEKQFTHKATDKFGYLLNQCMYKMIHKDGANKKVYEYEFTDEDFDNAESVESMPQVNDVNTMKKESGETKYLYTSYFGYVNLCSSPVTVEYHSADYGATALPKAGKFTVYYYDKYELNFTSYNGFSNPFSASKDVDYVIVSNGKKKFKQTFGTDGLLFKSDSYKLAKDDEYVKIYTYTFTDEDFQNAKPVE